MKPLLQVQRRSVLRGMAAALAAPGLGFGAAHAAASEPALSWLTERLGLVTGAGGNVVFHKGEQGLTIVDSGDAQHTQELLTLLDGAADGAPLRTLFNTHWHADHTGGNEALRKRGAHILAHENTKLWLGAEFEVWWRQTHHSPRPRTAWPDKTFYQGGSLDLGGGASVVYEHVVQAHTDGDIWLHFPEENVLVLGGLMSDGSYPICDIATGGWIGGLIDANTAILETFGDDTLLIPERGPARSMADLRAQLTMLEDVYTKMKALAQQGHSGHDMLEVRVTEGHDATWGDPTEFVVETYQGMAMHTYDMGGFI